MKKNKIAFVIDGYYGLTLFKYVKREYGKVINYEGLVNSTCEALGHILEEKCIAPANLRHYYMGTDLEKIDSERNEYENALKLSRFGARGRPLQNGREKGIDTMLFSDIKDEATAGFFDYLVLFAGDLDHITLVQDLKALGIKTVLLYGEIITNGVKTTGYSNELKSSCFKSVDLFTLLDNSEIFHSAGNQENSMSELMKGNKKKSSVSLRTHVSETATAHAEGGKNLLQRVVDSVNQVISDKEQLQGRKLSFAFQAQVGTQLKRNGILLPISLGEYLAAYPTVFRTGLYPITRALTVSVR